MDTTTDTPTHLSLSEKLSHTITRAARERVWLAFMVGLVFTCAIYRLELAAEIYGGVNQPSSLQARQVPLMAFLQTPLTDLVVILILGLAYFVIKSRLLRAMPILLARPSIRFVEAILAGVLLLVLALIMRVHSQLLFQLETGLTMTMIEMSPALVGPKDFFAMFLARDFIFVAAPLGVFLMALGGGGDLRRVYKWVALLGTVCILAVQLVPVSRHPTREISLNPVAYLFDDAMADGLHLWYNRNILYRDTKDEPGGEQLNSIQFVDGAFVNGPKRPLTAPTVRARLAAGKKWNILFFVLESTGSDYVFDQSMGNEVPMPFLQQLLSEGLYLTNHQSSANNSAKAAFSIFTGLYPPPTHDLLAVDKTVRVPTLNRYLGNDYHFFLIHPTDASYAFPEAMFRNNGLREFDSKETLPPGEHPDINRLARNELDTIDFFQTRLDRIPEPFLGVYWSFIPHFPYDDYGPEYRILPDLTDKRQLYYNNLRALDTQLRRVFDHLEKTGRLEHTVVVIVGDHGEAFNQHPGVWTHSLGSYSEMYRVPMLFWQPRLIPSHTVKAVTSHPDIVPTLLDILGVPYDVSRFQGESVLRGEPTRKYIFTMDARAQHISAISQQLNKVSVCFDDDTVTAFNLAKDPGEKIPLNEARYPMQVDALLKFYNYQTRLIKDYNDALVGGWPFPRHKRPADAMSGQAGDKGAAASQAGN